MATTPDPSFPTVRKGYEPTAVRDHLRRLRSELDQVVAERDRLAAELAQARAQPRPALDEATVAAALGEEAATVLRAAHEAAAQIRARADDETTRQRLETDEACTHLRTAAEEHAAQVRAETQELADRARHEIEAQRTAEVEAARQQGRDMVAEARAVRERMLHDLARRREAARQQIGHLLGARDGLVEVFTHARGAVDGVLADLGGLPPEPPEVDLAHLPGDVEVPAFVAAAHGVEAELRESEARHPTAHVPVEAAAPAEVEPSEAPEVPAADVVGTEGRVGGEQDGEQSVDHLFARLRGAKPVAVAVAVAEAAEAPHDVEAVDGEPEIPPEAAEAPVETAAGEPEVDAADGSVDDPVTALFRDREKALGPVRTRLARQLKRVLADEQNVVLDRLRSAKEVPALTELLGADDERARRYRDAAEDPLRLAALAGIQSIGAADPDAAAALLDSTNALERSLDEVATLLAAPLREHLARALDEAQGDTTDASGVLRSAYRDWKNQRIDELADELVLAAHGRGAFVALAPGTPVCWLLDPNGPGCPDAEDNRLAGEVPAGEPFPTGHRHAPAYPGCRCLIATTHH